MINNEISAINNYSDQASTDEGEKSISGEILLMMLLLTFSLISGYIVRKKKLYFFNESMCSTLLGLLAGFFMYIFENKKYMENISNGYAAFFLIFLLPPIIFQSAYTLKLHDFFKNLGSIMLYSILGTLIAIFTVALSILFVSHFEIISTLDFNLQESIAFGSIIASTDPICILSAFKDYYVDPSFFQVLFGESLMNDAVSIVFYEASSNVITGAKYVFKDLVITLTKFIIVLIGSISLGYFTGYLSSLLLKFMPVQKLKNIEAIEVGLVVILPWVSYLLAQIFDLSGIVAILFNGLANSAYTKPNITEGSSTVSINLNNII